MPRRSPIAIDFGSRSVTALQLEVHGTGMRVRAAGQERLPADAATDDEAAWLATGRRLLRRAGFRGRAAITALGLDAVATRHVRVASESDAEVGAAIAARLQDTIDGDDEVVVQPLPVAELFDQGERRRELLCCIARQPAIDACIERVERLRLRPQTIEFGPLAQLRTLVQQAPRESFAHLDLGADASRLGLVRAGQPFTVRPVPVAGETCRRQLEERLGLDLPTLQTLGEQSELDARLCAAAVIDALAEPIEQLVLRITEGIRYCGALFQGRAVTSLRVSGRLAYLPGLVAELGRRIGLRSEAVDPLTGIEPGPLAGATPARRSDFTTAVGLCLGGLSP